MYSKSQLQKELSVTYLVEMIKSKFQDFRAQSPDPKEDEYRTRPPKDWPYYNFTRSEFCKKIYLETKKFFDDHLDDLSPTDKMVVLKEYIQLWRDVEGNLDIQDTDFAEQYKDTSFGKYGSSYNPRAPMVAGFNLKNIDFGELFESDMLFLAVNLNGANFTHAQLPYTSFNDCNFTDSNVAGTNFNQCRFIQCNFEGVDLSETALCKAGFESCIMYQTKYIKKAGLLIYKCFTDNLLTASRDGKLDKAMQLVKTFPDLIHSCDVEGNTPLHLAVIKGQVEIIEFLLNNGAKIDAVNNYGLKSFCESLLHVRPYDDNYPLETFERIVKLFLEAGLDLNDTTHISKSYLGNLAFSGALEAIKILVANGADINIRDQFGLTPLHHASCGVKKGYFEKEQEEVAKWLVSIGADKNAKTNDGETALDFAKKFEHTGIVNLLKPNLPYPFFLQHLKVKPRQLTAEKVANALWLSDKDVQTSNISKADFALWAKKQKLHFNLDDVEKCLSSYVLNMHPKIDN